MVEGSDAIIDHHRSTDAPDPVTVADGLGTAIFVDEETWNRSAVDVPGELRAAAKAVHAEFAREVGTEYDREGTVPLVMPSRAVGQLVRAGLSQRAVGERLGMATNTVKVHCHRIDAKVEEARRLVELVER
jgi:ATP/maltotriose-dependent transcriptional regulator MalT